MSNKYTMKVKLQGLEFEIEGNREDAAVLSRNFGTQLSGLLQQGQLGHTQSSGNGSGSVMVIDAEPARARRRTSKRAGITHSPGVHNHNEEALNWAHDPERWGSPLQTWNTANKSIWLLQVAESEAQAIGMSGATIASTFNKHFREAKLIQVFNVNRDLGKLKAKPDSLVGQDTTQDPGRWFLTQSGKKQAERLILEAKGHSAA